MGNGVSWSPSNSSSYPLDGPNVPLICDNVRAQKLALEADDQLKGRKIDIVYGFSMGAMQALEWARAYPSDVKYSVPVCGSSGCNQINCILCDALAACLTTVALKVEKLKAFSLTFAGWFVGPDFYRNKEWAALGFSSLEDYEVNFPIAFFGSSDPDDLLAMLLTWRHTPPFTEDQCKAIVGPKVLLLPCNTDTYFRTEDLALLEKKFIPVCTMKEIISNWGHLAGNPEQLENEFAFIQSQVKAFCK